MKNIMNKKNWLSWVDTTGNILYRYNVDKEHCFIISSTKKEFVLGYWNITNTKSVLIHCKYGFKSFKQVAEYAKNLLGDIQ